ncbi:MAG TPA: glycosyl hydrolase [Polyangiaceae bacterium]|nr:glycosyl hydrolase [Polyangiaceae bacterium]
MNFQSWMMRGAGATLLLGGWLVACSSEAGDTDGAGDADGTSPDGANADGGPDAPSDGADGSDVDGDGVDGGGSGGSAAGPRGANCKRGLAYGGHSDADFAALSPALSWWYNWYFEPDEALRDGNYRSADVEYVPMYHSVKEAFDPDTMIERIPSDSKMLLGFNEPNFHVQANLSAAAAAAAWPEVERIADAHGLAIASPAVNYCGPAQDCWDTNPFDYLDDFFAACEGCRVDAIAFHIYVGCNAGGENHAQWLIDHVKNYEARFPEGTYPQKFLLTEFACSDAANFAEQRAFLEDAVEYLEGNPRVARYGWFSGRFDGMQFVDLYGADGQLTELGVAYRDAPQAENCKR